MKMHLFPITKSAPAKYLERNISQFLGKSRYYVSEIVLLFYKYTWSIGDVAIVFDSVLYFMQI